MYEKSFQTYKPVMDFAALLKQIIEQKDAAENLAERAIRGNITDDEALKKIEEISAASTSLKTTVGLFMELHKGDASQRDTLKDAIEKLKETVAKLKPQSQELK